jgi:hypothetical protein
VADLGHRPSEKGRRVLYPALLIIWLCASEILIRFSVSFTVMCQLSRCAHGTERAATERAHRLHGTGGRLELPP